MVSESGGFIARIFSATRVLNLNLKEKGEAKKKKEIEGTKLSWIEEKAIQDKTDDGRQHGWCM